MNAPSHDDLFAIADDVLARVGSDAEVTVVDSDAALTRFASNAIHQNVAEHGVRVRLRLQGNSRVGVATVEGNIEGHLQALVESAERSRALSPESDVSPLPARGAASGDEAAAYASSTADASPERRADAVATVVDAARAQHLQAYGAFDTATTRTAIATTTGLRRAATTTRSSVVAVVRGAAGSGYAARCAVDVDTIDTAGFADEVVTTCQRNQNAEAVHPGDYEVVLAPYAVDAMLEHLSWMGFSALAVEEGRSFMRPGQRLMDESVSIYDDPDEVALAPFPFDAEGVTAQRVSFVAGGTCRDVVHDSATAARAGVVSNGHALPMPNPGGPMASHLGMAPGTSDMASMIGNVRDGLFVTRFWYVRDVHPLRTVITGMTREGTFRIRDGRIVGAVRDLRFTQSITDALNDVRGISAARLLTLSEEGSAILAPALHLGSFTFSS